MSRGVLAVLVTLVASALVLLALSGVAVADHTDPGDQLSPASSGFPGDPGVRSGEGEWEFIQNFAPNPGSDIWFFTKEGVTYSVSGTLGQGPLGNVGQRILKLVDADGTVNIEWVADHGSAACDATPQTVASTTGLQHDSFATPLSDPELIIDTTDAPGRCHDPGGGGIELIDISGLGEDGFEVREVHLTRFNLTTHTATRYDERPWIVFSNNSAFSGAPWLDFMDIRSCLSRAAGGTLPDGATLDTKREQCRPVVYRVPFEEEWTQQTLTEDGEPQGSPASCHDTVIVGHILYCSGVAAELILDLSDMVDADGNVRGEPLPCQVVDGTGTSAKVTDCVISAEGRTAPEAYADIGSPQALGWRHVGHFNHPGRGDPSGQTTGGNTNLAVPADRGVAISHETRPLPPQLGSYMVVSDERGGGIVPGGANCTEENFDRYNHGGLHFFDISDPSNIRYAEMVDDAGNVVERAVWRGQILRPNASMCVVHRFRHLADEQRIVMAYYSQGAKILDYTIDVHGRFHFNEIASFIPGSPGPSQASTWTADVFRTEDNDDGTRTYWFATSDIARGIDIYTWTGPTHPFQDLPPRIERVFGPGRIDTAVEVSKRGFEAADTVVLARQDEYADALAGAPLAAHENAPILLTFSDRLPTATAAELDRLGTRRVILLGGEAAISEAVANELRQRLILVERVGGADRFETAALVAAELPASNTAFVTEGMHDRADRGWPDALSAAPYAAFTEQPVLLVTRGELPPATAQALSERGVTETVVVGGSLAVSESVVEEIRDAGHGPRRVFGADRYGTNAAVFAEALAAGMSVEETWLATGLNWPDALTAGAVAGGAGDALLLIHGQDLDSSTATRDILAHHAPDMNHVRLLGGTAAISAEVEEQLAALLTDRTAAAGEEEDPGSGGSPFPLLGLMVLPAAAAFGRARRRSMCRRLREHAGLAE